MLLLCVALTAAYSCCCTHPRPKKIGWGGYERHMAHAACELSKLTACMETRKPKFHFSIGVLEVNKKNYNIVSKKNYNIIDSLFQGVATHGGSR